MSFVSKAPITMLHKLFMGVLIIVIWNFAIGCSIEYPDVHHSIEDYDSKSFSLEEDVEESLQFELEENIIYENEYPYKQLERIVDETMKLLESDDEEEKKKLMIKPSDYKKYKPLRNIQVAKNGVKFGRIVGGANVEDDRCPAIVQEDNPKLLSDISGTEHWILNVNNMQQTVFRRTCINNEPCGHEHTDPYGYKLVCSQVTIKVPLFSIPVDQELVKENQVFSEYSFPSNCVCKLKQIK